MRINLYSTDNPAGFIHYFVAYLIRDCHTKPEEALERACELSKQAFENRENMDSLTDNQAHMVTNGWHFTYAGKDMFFFAQEGGYAYEEPFCMVEEVVRYWGG